MTKHTSLIGAIVVAVVALMLISAPPASAQAGMTIATAKSLMADLIDAGYDPTLARRNGVFFIAVNTGSGAQAPTAQAVQNFATSRAVTVRVYSAEFQ